MSAVASLESLPAIAVVSGHDAAPHDVEAAEQQRWLIWFGVPALFAAVFVAAALGSGLEWFLGLAVGSIIFDIGILVWLTLSSDTNGMLGGPSPSHH